MRAFYIVTCKTYINMKILSSAILVQVKDHTNQVEEHSGQRPHALPPTWPYTELHDNTEPNFESSIAM